VWVGGGGGGKIEDGLRPVAASLGKFDTAAVVVCLSVLCKYGQTVRYD